MRQPRDGLMTACVEFTNAAQQDYRYNKVQTFA